MERLIIGSAIAVTLAAGAILFWSTMDSTETRSGLSAVPARNGISLRAGTADRPFTKSKRKAPTPAATDKFEERSAEIAATPRTTERENAIRELAHEWAAKDLIAAERWAAAFVDPEDWERAMTHVCLEAAGRDPQEAIEIVQRHKLNPGTVESIVEQWAKSDFEAAADWVGELSAGKFRDNALARLALVRAETSPAEAAAMVSTSLAAGTAQEEAAISVLHQWLRQDPEAARQWVDLFPDGKLKERAESEIQGMAAHRAELQAAQ
ncbi:MAG: hypothetical protein ABIS50_09215 [Luteolibacter sp.]|uniref:hypothetical protein n=1 Tax=Luteolibacter sp. TaxID=1962973 RepID=UPI00326422CB